MVDSPMKTCTSYIHEYDLMDDLNVTIAETCNIVEQASTDYDNLIHKYELVSFFEKGVDDEEFITEKEGIFTRIGNGVINLVKKIGEIIKNIALKVTGKNGEVDKDKATVDEMISRHPEYKNDIIEGIEKEWFTFKDVASYEKDIVGLALQLKQHKIEPATFSSKCKAAAEKFDNTTKPINMVVTRISELLKAIAGIFKYITEGKSSLAKMQKELEKSANKSASKKVVKESTEDGDEWVITDEFSIEIKETNLIVRAFSLAVQKISSAIYKATDIYKLIISRIKNYLKSKLHKGKDDEEK